ncbi:MAG: 5'-methylthioadenosine/S-adenosylhomocysteine nucleosidase [Lachnospiraceae bacterium]|jgi:adenosylhomocysteine nucleosidase|nr:5'-methylthioadenosine/S-adenosylhomocysteine nucleosidase [Lachnospiraceae bacterium]
MKVGIICASDVELAPFLPEIEHLGITEKARLKYYEGEIHGMRVVALYCGVCRVNAAIASQILIDGFGVDIIINAGTAGGMNPCLDIFDTVISTEVCYHDVAEDILTEFHPWMKSVFFEADRELIKYSESAVSKMTLPGKVFWGRMVTGESFITDVGRDEINDRFAPLAVDMETAGIAHVCYVNGIPFLSIRCITDTAEHSGTGNFEENCEKASVIAKNITAALLDEIREESDFGGINSAFTTEENGR